MDWTEIHTTPLPDIPAPPTNRTLRSCLSFTPTNNTQGHPGFHRSHLIFFGEMENYPPDYSVVITVAVTGAASPDHNCAPGISRPVAYRL